MNQVRTCVLALIALLMTGCGAAGGPAPATGHLAGRLVSGRRRR